MQQHCRRGDTLDYCRQCCRDNTLARNMLLESIIPLHPPLLSPSLRAELATSNNWKNNNCVQCLLVGLTFSLLVSTGGALLSSDTSSDQQGDVYYGHFTFRDIADILQQTIGNITPMFCNHGRVGLWMCLLRNFEWTNLVYR